MIDKYQAGRYYSTSHVAWIIKLLLNGRKIERVLEPAVGSGALLTPWLGKSELFGFDIDATWAEELSSQGVNFRQCNFLEVEPKRVFDLVIGNPPYVKIGRLGTSDKQLARRIMKPTGVAPSSLWMPFIQHGLSFLRDGGVLAYVVPELITTTKVGVKLLSYLTMVGRVQLVTFNGKVTEANERCALLLVYQEGGQSHEIEHLHAPSLSGAAAALLGGEWRRINPAARGALRAGMIPGGTEALRLLTERYRRTVGSVSTVLTLPRREKLWGLGTAGSAVIIESGAGVDSFLIRKEGRERLLPYEPAQRPLVGWWEAWGTNRTVIAVLDKDVRLAGCPEIHPNDGISAIQIFVGVMSSIGQASAELLGRRRSNGLIAFTAGDVERVRLVLPHKAAARKAFKQIIEIGVDGNYSDLMRAADSALDVPSKDLSKLRRFALLARAYRRVWK